MAKQVILLEGSDLTQEMWDYLDEDRINGHQRLYPMTREEIEKDRENNFPIWTAIHERLLELGYTENDYILYDQSW
jgi:hypothetical protein